LIYFACAVLQWQALVERSCQFSVAGNVEQTYTSSSDHTHQNLPELPSFAEVFCKQQPIPAEQSTQPAHRFATAARYYLAQLIPASVVAHARACCEAYDGAQADTLAQSLTHSSDRRKRTITSVECLGSTFS